MKARELQLWVLLYIQICWNPQIQIDLKQTGRPEKQVPLLCDSTGRLILWQKVNRSLMTFLSSAAIAFYDNCCTAANCSNLPACLLSAQLHYLSPLVAATSLNISISHLSPPNLNHFLIIFWKDLTPGLELKVDCIFLPSCCISTFPSFECFKSQDRGRLVF